MPPDVFLQRRRSELRRPQVQEDGLVHEDRVPGRVDQKFFDQNVLKLRIFFMFFDQKQKSLLFQGNLTYLLKLTGKRIRYASV